MWRTIPRMQCEISSKMKIRDSITKRAFVIVKSTSSGKIRVRIGHKKLSVHRLIAKAFIDSKSDYKAGFIQGASSYLATNTGEIYSLKRKIFLKPGVGRSGYKQVVLRMDDGSQKTLTVHRLIALTFIHRFDRDRDVVNHIDHDKLNNDMENLEWTTSGGNSRAYRDHKLYSSKSYESDYDDTAIVVRKKHMLRIDTEALY